LFPVVLICTWAAFSPETPVPNDIKILAIC